MAYNNLSHDRNSWLSGFMSLLSSFSSSHASSTVQKAISHFIDAYHEFIYGVFYQEDYDVEYTALEQMKQPPATISYGTSYHLEHQTSRQCWINDRRDSLGEGLSSKPVPSVPNCAPRIHTEKMSGYGSVLQDKFTDYVVFLGMKSSRKGSKSAMPSRSTDVTVPLLSILALVASYASLIERGKMQLVTSPPEDAGPDLISRYFDLLVRAKLDPLLCHYEGIASNDSQILEAWRALVDVSVSAWSAKYKTQQREPKPPEAQPGPELTKTQRRPELSKSQQMSQPKGFLDLPGEIRNAIYGYLLPDSTLAQDCGLIWACKQIYSELSPMIVASADGILVKTTADSAQLRASVSQTANSPPLIVAPSVTILSHLHMVNINVDLDAIQVGRDPSSRAIDCQQYRKVFFSEMTAGLMEMLALHLPFVTIIIAIGCIASCWIGNGLHDILSWCYEVFKHLEKSTVVNARVVIFDLSGNSYGPYRESEHQPYIAFVARQLSKSGHVRFEFLGHEPRPQRTGISGMYGRVQPYDTYKDTSALDAVVREARLLAEHLSVTSSAEQDTTDEALAA